jgi:hypothetical protein
VASFRFHDLRHCAVTQLAENGTSDSTIMAIAGHRSRRMLERYSHVRMEASAPQWKRLQLAPKRRVVIQTVRQTPLPQACVPSKLSGDLVDLVGIEPATYSMPFPDAVK